MVSVIVNNIVAWYFQVMGRAGVPLVVAGDLGYGESGGDDGGSGGGGASKQRTRGSKGRRKALSIKKIDAGGRPSRIKKEQEGAGEDKGVNATDDVPPLENLRQAKASALEAKNAELSQAQFAMEQAKLATEAKFAQVHQRQIQEEGNKIVAKQ
jgi:hypothetical protein